MARKKVEKALAPMPRLRLGEIGSVGLKQSAGHIQEEYRRELRFPEACRTFRAMSQDATIRSAISLVEMMISRVDWTVDLGVEPDAAMKERGAFLESVIHDMDHSFNDFIREVTSMYTYGFCVNEKVYRRRTYEAGSSYNDNKIGIKKLPVRSQDTISKWIFSEDGRDLLGLEQSLYGVQGGERYINLSTDGVIQIPRKKFLLFRVDAKRDNPEGNSPLRGCYVAWLFRKQIEEQEAINSSGV